MLTVLIYPLFVLVFTGISVVAPKFGLSSLANTGPHGLSEIFYAYAEAAETRSSSKTTTGAKTLTKAPEKNKEKEKDRRLQFQANIGTTDLDVLDTVHLQFTNALQVMDPSKIRFTDRDYTDIDASLYHFKADSTNKIFWLFYPWKLETKYHLILNKDFAQDAVTILQDGFDDAGAALLVGNRQHAKAGVAHIKAIGCLCHDITDNPVAVDQDDFMAADLSRQFFNDRIAPVEDVAVGDVVGGEELVRSCGQLLGDALDDVDRRGGGELRRRHRPQRQRPRSQPQPQLSKPSG